MVFNPSLNTILAICTLVSAVILTADGTAVPCVVQVSASTALQIDLEICVKCTITNCLNELNTHFGSLMPAVIAQLEIDLDIVNGPLIISILIWLNVVFPACSGSLVSVEVLIGLVNTVCALVVNVLNIVLTVDLVLCLGPLVSVALSSVLSVVATALSLLLGESNGDVNTALATSLLHNVVVSIQVIFTNTLNNCGGLLG